MLLFGPVNYSTNMNHVIEKKARKKGTLFHFYINLKKLRRTTGFKNHLVLFFFYFSYLYLLCTEKKTYVVKDDKTLLSHLKGSPLFYHNNTN